MTDQTVAEPVRDIIGRALYEEPPTNGDPTPNWYALSEEKREPWRQDADRVVAAVIATQQERMARAILRCMDDHDGIDTFVEKLLSFPEHYCTDLATDALQSLKEERMPKCL